MKIFQKNSIQFSRAEYTLGCPPFMGLQVKTMVSNQILPYHYTHSVEMLPFLQNTPSDKTAVFPIAFPAQGWDEKPFTHRKKHVCLLNMLVSHSVRHQEYTNQRDNSRTSQFGQRSGGR